MDVEVLLAHVKSLAVMRRNNLVNILTLQGIGQERDKGVLAFLAHLKGQADLCNFNIVCPSKKVVSFKEKYIVSQLIR